VKFLRGPGKPVLASHRQKDFQLRKFHFSSPYVTFVAH